MSTRFIVVCVVLVLAILGVGLLLPVSKMGDRCLYGSVIELETPGGPLPFKLSYHRSHTMEDGWVGYINEYHSERSTVEVFSPTNDPDDIIVRFPHYDSELKLQRTEDGGMAGTWIKERGDDEPAIVNAYSGSSLGESVFKPIPGSGEPAIFGGRWAVQFESSDEPAIGEFYVLELEDEMLAFGTFMTTTGDYRYLSGRVDGNLMRLFTFDGAHAFLFHARMQDDGTIKGDFWSGNWWHETWTAVPDADAKLPDAFEQTVIADEDALGDMVFKNLDGEPTRVLDVLDESGAKARIIEIFGTWCPNCSDAGRELVSLREQYGDDLAVVGLAFEITEDFDRSVLQVTRHHEHIGTDWPILIAGLSDKDKASQALPVLDKVRSYPTLIFLDRNNEVQGVYSGFSGPATGDAYTQQRARFEALIDGMIED